MAGRPRHEGLASREEDLLNALMSGATTYKLLSKALTIEVGTVHKMLDRLYYKLSVRNLTELAIWRGKQMLEDMMKEVTDDWVATFEKPENQNGFVWRMAARCELPYGVNGFDERVIALVKLAQEQTGVTPDPEDN